ncbi:MAG: hypothetical protein K9J13_11180 [Saprospiraceae bacterium]|nr:hypothetical protein [Saprospiraceae bacterium]
MKKPVITLIVIMVSLTVLFGQNQEATTNNGRKIILKPDGTWEYKLEQKDSINSITTPDCSYSSNEVDEFTGKMKIIMNKQDFINYSPDELKKYYSNKDYFSCQVNVAKIENAKVAYFYWTIQTLKAYDYYGSISKGSVIIIKFKNSQTIEIPFAKYDDGDTKYDYGYTIYKNYVILDKSTVDSLKSFEIEKVRIYWSKGYQDYPVSNSKLFINQLPCID